MLASSLLRQISYQHSCVDQHRTESTLSDVASLQDVRIGYDQDRCVSFKVAEDTTVLLGPFVDREGKSTRLDDLKKVAEKENGRRPRNIVMFEKIRELIDVPKVEANQRENDTEQKDCNDYG